jgi:hypothetical protein
MQDDNAPFTAQAIRRVSMVLTSLLALRALIFILHAWHPITSPHQWRQIDTLAVSLRYWLRWSVEPNPVHPLLPAVLHSGDGTGIMAMEFPLYNLVTAPAFMFGLDTGRSLAHLLVGVAIALLVWGNLRVWRNVVIAGVPAPLMVLAFPIFSFAAPFTSKFIPDFTANLLMLFAVGLSWSRSRPLLSILAGAAGILIKPPAVILPALYLFHPGPWKERIRRGWWFIPALIIAALYYTKGTSFLSAIGDVSIYNIRPRPPLENLGSFFAEPLVLLDFLNRHLFIPFGIILYVLGYWLNRHALVLRSTAKLWATAILMIFAIACLDGSHSFVHSYYHTGTTAVAALLWLEPWLASFSNPKARFLTWLIPLAMLGRLIDISGQDLSYFSDQDGRARQFAECAQLRAEHPEAPWEQGEVFRSPEEIFPFLGLCFGERQGGTQSSWRIAYSDSADAGCEVVGMTTHFKLEKCK